MTYALARLHDAYGVMLRDKTTGLTGLSCLCLLTAYEELVEHFFPSSPTLWLCLNFLTDLQSIYNKIEETRILAHSWLSGHRQPYLTRMITVGHGLYVYCQFSESWVTSCTPCSGAMGLFVHTLLLHHLIPILTTASRACAAHPTAQYTCLFCLVSKGFSG